MAEITDVDDLPPVQQLVLEVLGARHRLGENLWTFSTKIRPAISQLEHMGLVTSMHGIVEKSLRASLTEQGKKLVLSEGYVPPIMAKVEAAESLFDSLGAFRDTLAQVDRLKKDL